VPPGDVHLRLPRPVELLVAVVARNSPLVGVHQMLVALGREGKLLWAAVLGRREKKDSKE
jgi:hypothetical protein